MDVLSSLECRDEGLIFGEVGQDPQLDLRVVGGEKDPVLLPGDEAAPDETAFLGGDISCDEWVARTLLAVLEQEPAAKIPVIVGNLHTLKKLEWEDHNLTIHLSIRQYIQRERPSTKMWSVGQLIHGNPNRCDFTRFVSINIVRRYSRCWL